MRPLDTFISYGVTFALGFIIACAIMDASWRKAAVKAGKAELYIDKNHKVQWRWK